MSNASTMPWSDNPNAPKIPYSLYLGEKAYFAGCLMGAMCYGIVVVLFFQCMGAFFDPVNRARGGISWALVAHTAATFLFATMYIAMSSNLQSISFIDNREFPASVSGTPGPVGYQLYIRDTAIGIAPTAMVLATNWLADALLLYRCYIVYVKNTWVIIFPFLMYLVSVATSIVFNYEVSRAGSASAQAIAMVRFGVPHFTVSFILNILLALMIIIRLGLYRRNIQNAMGTATGIGGLYKTMTTIFVESYALVLVTALLYVGTWAANSSVQYIFLQIFAQTQVIAPFLILLRIANRRAVTSETFASENAESIHFRSRGKPTSGGETPSGLYATSSMDAGELGVGVERTIDSDVHHDSAAGSEGTLGP